MGEPERLGDIFKRMFEKGKIDITNALSELYSNGELEDEVIALNGLEKRHVKRGEDIVAYQRMFENMGCSLRLAAALSSMQMIRKRLRNYKRELAKLISFEDYGAASEISGRIKAIKHRYKI